MTSKKQVIIILLIFVIPLISFFIIYNAATVSTINDRIAQSNKNTISIYEEAILHEMDNIVKYMIDMTAMNPDFQQLRNKRSNVDAYLNAYGIQESYRTMLNIHPMASGFFVYSKVNNMFKSAYNEGITYKYKYAAEAFIKSVLQDEKNADTRGWFTKRMEDQYFLFRILGNKGTYTICFIRLNNINVIKDFNNSKKGYLLISTDAGEPLTSIKLIDTEGIKLRGTAKNYYISGGQNRYLLAQDRFGEMPLNLVYMVPYHGVLYYMDRSQEILICASALILLLLPVCYRMLQKSYFKPLNRLSKTMNLIKAGNLDTKVESSYSIKEFRDFSDTFNEMMEQIQYYKISAYEKEIQYQRAQLQYLQLQIRPHFILNILKNIYGMAEEGKKKEIQEIILALSRNYRYMFRDSFELVSLSLEIENVENYINLQKLNHSCEIYCTVDIIPELMEFRLPPISVLTFVENSVKHGISQNMPLDIYIKGRLLPSEEGDFINITISDNGKGFSEEALLILNGKEKESGEDHIGIANVRHRFSLIYQDKSTICFSNQANGACVELFILYEPPNNKLEGK